MVRRNKKLACAIALAFTVNMCSSVAAETLSGNGADLSQKETTISNKLSKDQNKEEVKESKEAVKESKDISSDNVVKDDKHDSTAKDENSLKDNSDSKSKESLKENKVKEEESNIYDRDSYVPDSEDNTKSAKKFSKAKSIENISIVSETNITKEQAKKWAADKKATQIFIDLADLFWKYAKDHGNINPAVAYIQAAKETGYGRFGGVIDESYHNTCGLKNSSGGDDRDPNAHYKFNTWDEGVQAHLDHLALYAGAEGYPRANTYDPRHFASIKGKAPTLAELGGKWAPSAAYGTDLVAMYNALSDTKIDTNENVDVDGKWIEKDDVKYFLKKDGSYAKGWLKLNGKKYYLNLETGAMIKGWCLDNGNWYYLTYDGTMVTGLQNLWGTRYYLDEETGARQTGWINDNGDCYFANSDGILQKGWLDIGQDRYFLDEENCKMKVGKFLYGDTWFYMNNSGKMMKGWYINENNKYYYLDPSSGEMMFGWQKVNNNWYFLTYDGTMVTGVQNLWGTSYYLDRETGAMKTGWINDGSDMYLADGNGVLQKGLYFNGTDYYLFDNESCKMKVGKTQYNDKWYYMGSNGNLLTGWCYDGVNWYYMDPASGEMTFGWKKQNGNWYYFYETGIMACNTNVGDYVVGEDGVWIEGAKPTTKSKLIVVDPGHDYGGDYGCVGRVNGKVYEETVLDMEVAVQIKASLESKGYKVQMTRQPWDRPVSSSWTESLSARTSMANSLKADLFISVHHDSATESAHGVTTFYSSYKPGIDNEGIKEVAGWGGTILADMTPSASAVKSKSIAQKVVNNLASKDSYYNRGANDRNLYVTKNTNMPSLLIECGFLTNPSEAAKSADLENQKKIGNIVADSVESEL